MIYKAATEHQDLNFYVSKEVWFSASYASYVFASHFSLRNGHESEPI